MSIVPTKVLLLKYGHKAGKMTTHYISEQDYEKLSDDVSTMVSRRQAIHIKSYGELMANNTEKRSYDVKLPHTTSVLQLCVTWN